MPVKVHGLSHSALPSKEICAPDGIDETESWAGTTAGADRARDFLPRVGAGAADSGAGASSNAACSGSADSGCAVSVCGFTLCGWGGGCTWAGCVCFGGAVETVEPPESRSPSQLYTLIPATISTISATAPVIAYKYNLGGVLRISVTAFCAASRT